MTTKPTQSPVEQFLSKLAECEVVSSNRSGMRCEPEIHDAAIAMLKAAIEGLEKIHNDCADTQGYSRAYQVLWRLRTLAAEALRTERKHG